MFACAGRVRRVHSASPAEAERISIEGTRDANPTLKPVSLVDSNAKVDSGIPSSGHGSNAASGQTARSCTAVGPGRPGFSEVIAAPDRGIPQDLLDHTHSIVIVQETRSFLLLAGNTGKVPFLQGAHHNPPRGAPKASTAQKASASGNGPQAPTGCCGGNPVKLRVELWAGPSSATPPRLNSQDANAAASLEDSVAGLMDNPAWL